MSEPAPARRAPSRCHAILSRVLPGPLVNQLFSLVLNLRAWSLSLCRRGGGGGRSRLAASPSTPLPVAGAPASGAVLIDGPGGMEQLEVVELADTDRATVGYNVAPHRCPLTAAGLGGQELASDLCLVRIEYFSINFADVAIRWGLYESANQKVGYPICPGFDFSGTIERAGADSGFRVGDDVFGFTMFGAYSTRLLVPASQIRHIPRVGISTGSSSAVPGPRGALPTTPRRAIATKTIAPAAPASACMDKALMAGLPAVAATALHAIALAGAYPQPLLTRNRAALVHSAAGGVGSMLLQMCRLRGFSPIVAVVGAADKVAHCRALGADVVIAKQEFARPGGGGSRAWWALARESAPDGFAAIFDANGVETLADSYANLARCGRLVLYGFHSNMPVGTAYLAPWHWAQMVWRMARMPAFDPMDLVLSSRAVAGFNLSFFADEHELIDQYMTQLLAWLADGSLRPAPIAREFALHEVGEAHALIQSGRTTGKLVVKCV